MQNTESALSTPRDRHLESTALRPCPDCGLPRGRWRENRGRGCPGDDGELYCGQRCAGKIDAPAA